MTDRYRVDELTTVACIWDTELDAYTGLDRPDGVHEVLRYATPDDAHAWLQAMPDVRPAP